MNDYFYLDTNNLQQGPISPERFAANGVTPHTLVWCVGMSDWQPAESVPELKCLFTNNAHSKSTSEPPNPYGPNRADAEPSRNFYGQQAPGNQAPYNPYSSQPNTRPPRPDNYLVWSVLVTICCCLPFGIVAIVHSFEVDKFYAKQLYDQALIASEDAKKWCILSLVFGILSFFAWGGLSLLKIPL